MKRIVILFIIQFIFHNCIAQNIPAENDSVLTAYLNVFKTTCANIESKTFRNRKQVNIEYDKTVLKYLSGVIHTFQESGKVRSVSKYFRVTETGSGSTNSFIQYACYTSDKNGDLSIYLRHETDSLQKTVKIQLKILTSSKLYCSDGKWQAANFDAVYFRKLVSSLGFRFILHAGSDQLYLVEERKL